MWMAEQSGEDLFISSLRLTRSAAEYWRTPLESSAGRLERGFSGPEGPRALFAGRVLPFDKKAALGLGAADGRRDGEGAPVAPSIWSSPQSLAANTCVGGHRKRKRLRGDEGGQSFAGELMRVAGRREGGLSLPVGPGSGSGTSRGDPAGKSALDGFAEPSAFPVPDASGTRTFQGRWPNGA